LGGDCKGLELAVGLITLIYFFNSCFHGLLPRPGNWGALNASEGHSKEIIFAQHRTNGNSSLNSYQFGQKMSAHGPVECTY
jgi:hypothetical protein